MSAVTFTENVFLFLLIPKNWWSAPWNPRYRFHASPTSLCSIELSRFYHDTKGVIFTLRKCRETL